MALPHFQLLPACPAASFWGIDVYKLAYFILLAAICAGGTFAPVSLAGADDNVLGMPKRAVKNEGSLVICGGGDLPESVYQRFVELAGGRNARLVIIPTAARFENVGEVNRHFSDWKKLDVASLNILDADSREDADDAEFVEPLRKATGVWINGGVQGRLRDIYGGTQFERSVLGVLERGGVVGGTSAGAAIMSRTMIRRGRSPEAVVLDDGFGLLSRAVIDTHFSQRKRLPRLLGVLYDNPGQVGLGIDENTALVVQGSRLSVLGDATVTLCMAGTKTRPQWTQKLKTGEEARLTSLSIASGGELETVRLRKVASVLSE